MNTFKDMPLLPPFCPHCHKSFFWAGPAYPQQKRSCECKKGRKLFADWMTMQSAMMSEMTDPTEILTAPVIEVPPTEPEEVVNPADSGDSCDSVDTEGTPYDFGQKEDSNVK